MPFEEIQTSFNVSESGTSRITAGMWTKCKQCGALITASVFRENMMICTSCGYYHPMNAWERILQLTDSDKNGFTEMDAKLTSGDPLEFSGTGKYAEKVAEARNNTGLNEAVVTGKAYLEGMRFGLAVMDFRFMGASMGSAVGEKITRVVEWATKRKLPMVIVTASGGARMQEGTLSLMQMAKTSGAVMRHDEAGLPLFVLLTNPTTGGVTASFASLGDILLAEPGALIGFAGPRVVEQTIHQKLPPNFQTAEYLIQRGFVDAIVERKDQRKVLARLLRDFNRR